MASLLHTVHAACQQPDFSIEASNVPTYRSIRFSHATTSCDEGFDGLSCWKRQPLRSKDSFCATPRHEKQSPHYSRHQRATPPLPQCWDLREKLTRLMTPLETYDLMSRLYGVEPLGIGV